MKMCSECKQVKDAFDFAFRNKIKGILQSSCKSCKNSYSSDHYKSNLNYYKNKAYHSNKRLKKKLHSIIDELKNVPCMDCQKIYPPYVMDFDHLRDKCFDIGSAISTQKSLSLILEEITKCEVVCANCHRDRTYKRLHGHVVK